MNEYLESKNNKIYFSPEEIAQELGVPRFTIYKMCEREELISIRWRNKVIILKEEKYLKQFEFMKREDLSEEDKSMLCYTTISGFNELDDWYKKNRGQISQGFLNILRNKKENLIDYLERIYDTKVEFWKMNPRAPEGCWDNSKRCQQYLNWLAMELGITCDSDWYRVTRQDFNKNYGGSLLVREKRIVDILNKYLHPKVFNELNFSFKPQSFWTDQGNIRIFIEMIIENEKLIIPEDFNKINVEILKKYNGLSLVHHYPSIADCIIQIFPEYRLNFWLFKHSRNWLELSSQRQYLDWLGNKLGFTKQNDWYNINEEDFQKNYGGRLLDIYEHSISNCVSSIYLDKRWKKSNFYKQKFKNELRVFSILECIFPNYEVEYRYKHPYLRFKKSNRPIELDVFVPSLDFAVEYQGKQHYEPVEIFDGNDQKKAEESFNNRVERDKEKQDLCKFFGITLVHIPHNQWNGSIVDIISLVENSLHITIEHQKVYQEAMKAGLIKYDFDIELSAITNDFEKKSAKHKVKSNKHKVKSNFTKEYIIECAKNWKKLNNDWPKKGDGLINDDSQFKWIQVHNWLLRTYELTLAGFLFQELGVIHHLAKNKLSVSQIIEWAKHHYDTKGDWPTHRSGPVLAQPTEDWARIRYCLLEGLRGLPSKKSLEVLLYEELGVKGYLAGKKLTESSILDLARKHFASTGKWPTSYSPWIFGDSDNWNAIDVALRVGHRGLLGGSSLSNLLHINGCKLNRTKLKIPSLSSILEAADKFYEKFGDYPKKSSGVDDLFSKINWHTINNKLKRGLISGTKSTSLAELWEEHFNRRNVGKLDDLSEKQVLNWCEEFYKINGKYPTNRSNSIPSMGSETFMSIDTALREDRRGFEGFKSLSDLLAKYKLKRNHKDLPNISIKEIEEWMLRFYSMYQRWPTAGDKDIFDTGEKWSNLNACLHRGARGLPKGSSLSKIKKKLVVLPDKSNKNNDSTVQYELKLHYEK